MLVEKIIENQSEKTPQLKAVAEHEVIKFPRKRKFKKRLREEGMVKPRSVIPIHESEADLCIILWRSVIVQALYDIAGKGGGVARKIIRAEGLAWFSGKTSSNQSSFELVCELANLNPSSVLALVKEVRCKGEEVIEGFNFRTVRRDYSSRCGRRTGKPRHSS